MNLHELNLKLKKHLKKIKEADDQLTQLLQDRIKENGWDKLSVEEIDKQIKEIQSQDWYPLYTRDITALEHQKAKLQGQLQESTEDDIKEEIARLEKQIEADPENYELKEQKAQLEASLHEAIDSDKLYMLDDMVAYANRRVDEINKELSLVQDGEPYPQQLIKEKEYLLQQIKVLNSRREKVLNEEKINELSDELVDKVYAIRDKQIEDAIKVEQEAFDAYLAKRKLGLYSSMKEFNAWMEKRNELEQAWEKTYKNHILSWRREENKDELETSQTNEALNRFSDYKRFYGDLKEFRADMSNRFPGDKHDLLRKIDDIMYVIEVMWDGQNLE